MSASPVDDKLSTHTKDHPSVDGQHPLSRVHLDSGSREPRIRQRWWQLWIPAKAPPPAPASMLDAPIIPIVTASLWSKMTYSWLTPIMVLGYQRTLQPSDLWQLDESLESGALSDKLDEAWARRVKEAEEWNEKFDKDEVHPSIFKRSVWNVKSLRAGTGFKDRHRSLEREWKTGDGKKQASLAWALNDVLGHMFWIGGLYKVFGDTCQLMGPILIKAIINFARERATALENGTQMPNIGRGIGMALGLFCLIIMASVSQHQFFWRSMTTGVLARAALINSIYKRGVALSPKSRTQFSPATLVTHISTDVSRIDAASQWFHASWTAPIQVSVCLIILVVQLGPSALAGFVIFAVLIPIQEQVMSHRLKLNRDSLAYTDRRGGILMEALNAIRVVKFFCYEIPLLRRIFDIRRHELKGVRQMQHAQSAITAFAYSTPVLAATLAFVTYTSTTPGFDVAIIFASFSLFQLLRQPMMFLPRALSNTADAQNSLERLSKLFHADIMTDTPYEIDDNQKFGVLLDDATFEWEVTEKQAVIHLDAGVEAKESSPATPVEPFSIKNISMSIAKGTLVGIVGPVGSGKSSLLQGMIGEMRKVSGKVCFGGPVAYCSQVAWIQNATLRDNVLFGRPYDEGNYWRVLEKACLLPDLKVLPDGDLTEIGEKGINLSGGQKQRVNIARALYHNSDIIILDDPLSAVDAHVGKSLFHDAILPFAREGRTVVLVTHAQHFLPYCDYIFTLHDGKIMEEGTYSDLIARDGEFARLDREFGNHSQDTSDVRIAGTDQKQGSEQSTKQDGAGTGKEQGRLIRKENRTTGSVSWSVYGSYWAAGRGLLTGPMMLFTMLIMQGCQIMNSYTLVWWQANTFDRPFSFYQVLYAVLGIAQAIFTFLLGIVLDFVSMYVSQNLYHNAMQNIFHAPVSFFDTTPAGRIMSVFGKDIDTIDGQLPRSMRLLALTCANVLGAVVIVSVLLPYFLIVGAAIFVAYNYFASFYRASALETKRLDAMLRSLLYSHFSESLTGLSTVRIYGEVSRFVRDNKVYIDLENRALLLTVTNQRWLAVRLDFMGAFMVLAIAIFCVVGIRDINPAQIGLILSYMTTLTQICGMLTRQYAEVENYMNSVERVVHYSTPGRIDQEAPHEIPDQKPPSTWPARGSIAFKNVSLSYRPGLPTVLYDISLSISGGEKIGIVGRTGAGKSSLVLSLLRIVEFSGCIEIDGIDISKIGLRDLRSSLAIIPQDPTLFSGTVRTALDPFSQYDDAHLWDALRRSYLVASDTSDPEKPSIQTRVHLDSALEPEGANLSVGERSLLSLARALVKNSRVVILDEATASVDLETDKKIQETIQTQFVDRTLLCIAHRLRTILSYDRILVLESGAVAEFDTPWNLFSQNDSIFRGLCNQSGISTAEMEKAVQRYIV